MGACSASRLGLNPRCHVFSISVISPLPIMGMPCELNSVLKLSQEQGYPSRLKQGDRFQATKSGYRLFAMDVPLQLVDAQWQAQADVTIHELIWRAGQTHLQVEVARLYERPFSLG